MPPTVPEHDPAALSRYLLSFRWPFRDETIANMLVGGGLPLWRQVLDFVPERRERGTALELGSPPFHMTLLLQKLRNYDLSLTGSAVDGREEIRQTVDSPEFDERYDFVCRCFDVEKDRWPYPEAAFDLVTYVEVIEHLTQDPVHTLAEIHRVLKPGGSVVISTPNVARTENIVALFKGHNVYDPYHLGSPLRGSRHSREWTMSELTGLLEGCGFTVDRAENIDIYPPGNRKRRVFRWLMNTVVARVTGGSYRVHLFVRARKTERPFRWHFPEALFDQGHLAQHIKPRDTRVVMGENDAIHRSFGWGPLAEGPGGRTFRRTGDVGDVYLLSDGPLSAATATLAGGKGELQAWHDNDGNFLQLGATKFEAPAGRWTEVTVALSDAYEPGNPLHIRLDVPGGVDVAQVAAR